MHLSHRRGGSYFSTALAGFALILSACGSDKKEEPAPLPVQNATTATATPSPTPAGVSVTDLLGRKVTVAKTPAKIVTTSPSALEIL